MTKKTNSKNNKGKSISKFSNDKNKTTNKRNTQDIQKKRKRTLPSITVGVTTRQSYGTWVDSYDDQSVLEDPNFTPIERYSVVGRYYD